jgi:O-antigen ligase
MFGVTAFLTRAGLDRLCRGVISVGLGVAMLGIIQKSLPAGMIYGFWQPTSGRDPFGPFVNRNHFAGWMLMAIPLAMGYFISRLAVGMRSVRPSWRQRVLWLSSSGASEIIVIAVAILVMAISLFMTLSRSGIISFVAAIAIFWACLVRREITKMRYVLASLCLCAVLAIAIGTAGISLVSWRFVNRDMSDLDGRIGAWSDAWHVARRFPLVGTGLNTYGIAMSFYQTADLARHYQQAHNDYLQLAAEGGALICIPVLMAVILLGGAIRRRFRESLPRTSEYWIRVGAVIGILAVAIQEVGDFSLQMPGNAALFSVLAGVALKLTSTSRDSHPMLYRGG